MSRLIGHAYQRGERRGWMTLDAISYCSLNLNAQQSNSCIYNERRDQTPHTQFFSADKLVITAILMTAQQKGMNHSE